MEKYYQHRRNVSPSPQHAKHGDRDHTPATGSDDDEETLQLQLKAIEAKLKLKKVQKQKLNKDPSESAVEVPSSPKRRQLPPPDPQSPRRTQLGIDKGLKASDVSLKNARSLIRPAGASGTLQPRQTRREPPKATSFAQRLAATRSDDQERAQKQRNTNAGRSRSFGVGQGVNSSQKENKVVGKAPKSSKSGLAHAAPLLNHSPGRKPREQYWRTPRVARTESDQEHEDHDPYSGFLLSKRDLSSSILDQTLQDKEHYPLPRLLKEVHSPDYDPPDVPGDYVVYGIIASKSKPKDHAANNLTTASNPDSQPQRSKFMVIRLTDLEWEIDLYLFGEGFETFWKLTVGTVIAILNPGIMPPKPHARDSGKFSLKLGSSEDTVLEIGISADLTFCKSVKGDGKTCDQWIDGRKTEYCDFHVGLQVARTKSSRMEINTMGTFGLFSNAPDRKGRGGRGGGGRGRSNGNHSRGGGRGRGKKEDTRLQGQYFDREAREQAYTIPSSLQRGGRVTELLDAEDYGPGAGLSAAERLQKRRAAREKERDLARALGDHGGGVGVEYLRSAHQDPEQRKQNSSSQHRPGTEDEPKDASSYGLLRSSAAVVNLDPTNGRQSRKEAVGWSKAFKRGLSPTARARSPSPKKARFMIEGKGVRTPGVDSSREDELRRSAENKKRRPTFEDDDDLELV